VGPASVLGIELNSYAAELARVVIWIGEIQWMLANGFSYLRDPILRPLDNIACHDAILDTSDPAAPREPSWPAADVIIGNPPFLGGKLLRSGLGNDYVEALFRVYRDRVPAEADLVCYWHEKARAMVANGTVARVGLLATQGIRGGANRRVLERIKDTGAIFLAWSDEPWVVEGAAVHVSIIGYDDSSEPSRTLDGRPVTSINANLTAGLDLTRVRRLPENLGIGFMGDTKGGPFDIPATLAREILASPNADSRSNAEVVRPWANGLDVTRRPRAMDHRLRHRHAPRPGSPLRAAVRVREGARAAGTHRIGVKPTRNAGGCTWNRARRCGGRSAASTGSSRRRGSQSTGCLSGCRRRRSQTASSSCSRETTTTSSGCSTRAFMRSGRAGSAPNSARSRAASATRRRPRSRPSRCRNPRPRRPRWSLRRRGS
jgi:hypothetical protein